MIKRFGEVKPVPLLVFVELIPSIPKRVAKSMLDRMNALVSLATSKGLEDQ